MAHPLVEQLRFARSEFRRGLVGITDEEARRRFPPLNAIGWNVGHLASQEQRYWLIEATGRPLLPEVDAAFRSGAPASAPPLDDAWRAWETITAAADPWLDGVTGDTLLACVIRPGWSADTSVGTLLLRVTYHYWYHTGENAAIRQLLGHTDLPEFVGNIDTEAPYRPA